VKHRLPLAVGTAVAAALMVTAAAQQLPVIREATFEAATIKRNDSGRLTWNVSVSGRYAVTNVAMERFITAAFQLHPDQVAGLPPWARSEGWDITARFDPQLGRPADNSSIWQLALRHLLAERAQLKFRREVQQRPVYALARVRANGPLGPNIKPARIDCDALQSQVEAAARSGQPSPIPPPTDTYYPCGLRSSGGQVRLIRSGGVGLFEFMQELGVLTGRTVIDRTGLEGRWDFFLTFTPPDRLAAPGAAADAAAPDLFTAVREQLGLKLESAEGPVNMFVVERLERPAAD
jgi:uncharacterized protein (TIGR03435 family)